MDPRTCHGRQSPGFQGVVLLIWFLFVFGFTFCTQSFRPVRSAGESSAPRSRGKQLVTRLSAKQRPWAPATPVGLIGDLLQLREPPGLDPNEAPAEPQAVVHLEGAASEHEQAKLMKLKRREDKKGQVVGVGPRVEL